MPCPRPDPAAPHGVMFVSVEVPAGYWMSVTAATMPPPANAASAAQSTDAFIMQYLSFSLLVKPKRLASAGFSRHWILCKTCTLPLVELPHFCSVAITGAAGRGRSIGLPANEPFATVHLEIALALPTLKAVSSPPILSTKMHFSCQSPKL